MAKSFLILIGLSAIQLPSGIPSAEASHQPSCKVYVATNSPYVHVIDTIDGTESVLPSNGVDGSGAGQWSVGVDRTGEKLYVGLVGAPLDINVFETTNYSLIDTIPAVEAYAIASSPTSNWIYAVDYSGAWVRAIDSDDPAIIAMFPVGINPADLAVSSDGRFVFVANSNMGTITRITPEEGATTDGVLAGAVSIPNPMSISLSPDDSSLYVVGSSIPGTLARVDSDTLNIVDHDTVGNQLYGVAVTPDGERVLATSSLDNKVYVRNALDLSGISELDVDPFPTRIEVTPDGKYAYVLSLRDIFNLTDDTISQIKLDDMSITSMPLGAQANSLSIGPSNCVTEQSAHRRSPRRAVTLDPNGGSCATPELKTSPWTVRFRGSTLIPGPTECTRDGFVFGGWADVGSPDVRRELAPVDDGGTERYRVTRSASLIAMWHRLPSSPTVFVGSSRFFCTGCSGVWLLWNTPPDATGTEVRDSAGQPVCQTEIATYLEWTLCNVPGSTSGSHTFSVIATNEYGASPPVNATVTFES